MTYDLIKKTLDVAVLRHNAISSNIANVNTPNYKVNKVEFEKFLAEAKEGMNMVRTNEMHFGLKTIDEIQPVLEKRMSTSMNDTGNNVDIDMEMAELAANEIYHSTLIQQINSKLGSLSYVINK